MDELQAFLKKRKVEIVDPAAEYYDDYYAVFFLDPDGLKLEGMKYGELTAKKKAQRAQKASRRTAARPKRKAKGRKRVA